MNFKLLKVMTELTKTHQGELNNFSSFLYK